MQSAETKLITLERSQKLDLLIHLISNLRQALVICGAGGIGKTTLLNELELRKQSEWPIVTIQATSVLSFESIQGQVLQSLRASYTEYKDKDLSTILSALMSQSQKVVVLIDDAGQLVPGLVSALIEYALSHLCLRIVFSLTHDELHIKNSTDRQIDDCHFIEIPPLTEKQCGVFLQNLSSHPKATVAFGAINDRMVEKLYRETHGIPGNIVLELPKLANYKKSQESKGIMFVIAAFFIVAGIGFVLYEAEINEQVENQSPLVLEKADFVEIVSPIVVLESEQFFETEVVEESKDKTLLEAKGDLVKNNNLDKKVELDVNDLIKKEKDNPHGIEQIFKNKDSLESKKSHKIAMSIQGSVPVQAVPSGAVVNNLEKNTSQELEKAIKQKATPVIKAIGTDDGMWVLKQPGKNYTIQLMVLSKRSSISSFLKKNPSLKEGLKFYKVTKKAQSKFVLIFGSFKSTVLASKKMKSLPEKFRKSWIRRFKTLQIALKN